MAGSINLCFGIGLDSTLLGSDSTRGAKMWGLLTNAIDGGNLTLTTNSLTFSNLQDSDTARSFGIGLSAGNRSSNSSENKGSGNISIDYSMHDLEQTTFATIGFGKINLGSQNKGNKTTNQNSTAQNLANLNRNFQTAQLITKNLSVEPISFKTTFEWGRNSAENQKKANSQNSSNNSGNNSENPSQSEKSDTKITDSNQNSLSNKIGAALFGKENPTLFGAIANSEYLTQINPLRAFSNSLDGISTDLKNMRTELGIETKALDVGDDRKFINIDKNGNQIGNAFTFEEYLKDPSLAANKLFSNGIMNNFNDAQKNALSQLGGVDESGRITILFDPTAFPDDSNAPTSKKIEGFFSDVGEVSVNYLGANILGGAIQTKGQATDQKFITAVANHAKETGNNIILAGHSGGGLRNYLALQNSSPNQYLANLNDPNSSVLIAKFSGAPANELDIKQAAANAGITNVYTKNKSGDFVGNFLGANGSIIEAGWSGVNVISLFELKIEKLNIKLKSPHSTYPCIGIGCNSTTNPNFNLNQNSPLAPTKTINLNSDSR